MSSWEETEELEQVEDLMESYVQNANRQRKIVDIQKVVGKGYADFWNFRGRYRICKGGRGSKKSFTAALWYIYHTMAIPDTNTLVIRRYFNTHFNSTRATLVKAIDLLGVRHLWHIPKRENTLTYKPTGQKIIFRGLDDAQSITSIQVEQGYLCWVWFEEAFQIEKEDDFNKIDMSIRGLMPDHVFKQLTITLNPWSDKHWIKRRFFDRRCTKMLLHMTTNYMINEFLDEHDIAIFDDMKATNPRRYLVEGLGEWGIAEGLVYQNWRQEDFNYRLLVKKSLNMQGQTHLKFRFGLDFGFTNDVSAFIALMVDERTMKIYVFDETYKHGQTNMDIANMIKEMGYDSQVIRCDSSEPKSIEELKIFGIRGARKAVKGKGSIIQGISKIQDYELIVHPSCTNFINEISSYVYEVDKLDDTKLLNKPVDENNHLMDAMRYALEDVQKKTFRW